MRKPAAALGTLVMGVGMAAGFSTSAANADLVDPVTPAVTSLHVVVGAPKGPGPSKRTEPVVVLLRCVGPGNEHPYPAEACTEVEAVKGDIAAIPPLNAGCAGVWQPVDISVSGVVRDEPVYWTEEVSNEGCAVTSHGHVFRIPLDGRTP
ncbi:SSI family serine proteinase inhibitor [Plantactinospora sp. B5E13]|uniref:SSI family serine proteinase inhibitor n=1 Tax=unclassified Plantactinospora TaxID=2631981 RepID=UPI00325D9B3A